MRKNIIKDKSFEFALRIIQLYKYLTTEQKEYIKQLLRSGIAIGVFVRESEHAESKADFIHKLSIALKEANETEYWLDLLNQSSYIDKNRQVSISNDIKDILRLLISIIKTSKRK